MKDSSFSDECIFKYLEGLFVLKKLLFICNVGYRFNAFAYSSSIAAKKLGIEFHIAAAWSGYDNVEDKINDEKKYGITIHQIDFIRQPYDLRNIKAYKQIVKLIQEEKIDFIHCNTPIGGVVGRIAGKKCGIKPLIYQAHGFHFYKGSPPKNWMLYYPIERWLARYTDALITINKEDYQCAKKKFKLRNHGEIFYVPGVGIDTSVYELSFISREKKREELGLSEHDVVLISVGDLNKNKNTNIILDALYKLKEHNVHYLICGEGPLKDKLIKKADRLQKNVHFLGYRTDIKELLNASDIFVLPSYREGLSRSLMEAMASSLPCVVSEIRGNVDLLKNGYGGFLVNPNDVDGWIFSLRQLIYDKNKRMTFGKINREVVETFSLKSATESIMDVYKKVYLSEM